MRKGKGSAGGACVLSRTCSDALYDAAAAAGSESHAGGRAAHRRAAGKLEERRRSQVAIEPPSVRRCSTVQMEIGGDRQYACGSMCTSTVSSRGFQESGSAPTMNPFRPSERK